MSPEVSQTAAVATRASLNVQSTALTFRPTGSIFDSDAAFASAQRKAQVLVAADTVPERYQNNMPNVLIALDFAGIVGVPVLFVMQNLDVIKKKPSWSGKFQIAAVRGCGRFTNVKFVNGTDGTVQFGNGAAAIGLPNHTCFMQAQDIETGELVIGTTVSMRMAVLEGWYGKQDSKWQTMPELMLQYRAGAFFARVHIPDILLGMQSSEELLDVAPQRGPVFNDAGTGATDVSAEPYAASTAQISPAEPAARKTRTRRAAPVVSVEMPEANEAGTGASDATPADATVPSQEPEAPYASPAHTPEAATIATPGTPAAAKETPQQTRDRVQAAQYPEMVATRTEASAPAKATGTPVEIAPRHSDATTWPAGFEFITVDGEVENAGTIDRAEPIGQRLKRFNEQIQYHQKKHGSQPAADVPTPEADAVQMPNPNGDKDYF